MSLWPKPASQITFADIDQFCREMHPEGARLDYKGIAFPKDLAKTISAFANTLGGLILLGIEADKKSNTPIWPPKEGMPMENGLSERVIQKAHDGIVPPVRVSVSDVIHNDLLPNHAILVIRVNESREAPHAVEKNTQIYVYDRTANKNEPYDLADIPRIEYLLSRRNRLTDRREVDLQASLDRGLRVMHRSICPIRWISVAPVYPWRDIHDQYDCGVFHKRQVWGMHDTYWSYQTVPGGSFATGRRHEDNRRTLCMACTSVSANGTLFGMHYTRETMFNNETLFQETEERIPGKMWVDMDNFRKMTRQFLASCSEFYSLSSDAPGEVMLSIGLKNAQDVMMYDSFSNQKTDSPFPDPDYRIDTILNVEQLGLRMPEVDEVFNDIIFAFNAGAIQSS